MYAGALKYEALGRYLSKCAFLGSKTSCAKERTFEVGAAGYCYRPAFIPCIRRARYLNMVSCQLKNCSNGSWS